MIQNGVQMASKRHQNLSIWCPRIHFLRFLWFLVGLFFGCAFGGRRKAPDSHGGYLPGLEGIALGPGSVVVADIYMYIYMQLQQHDRSPQNKKHTGSNTTITINTINKRQRQMLNIHKRDSIQIEHS